MKLFLRKLQAFINLPFPSKGSKCKRCLRPLNICRIHLTIFGEKNSKCFPLCQGCWKDLTPDTRLPYYWKLWKEWRTKAFQLRQDYKHNLKQWAEIKKAVLEGK